jgi:hypothetical protein
MHTTVVLLHPALDAAGLLAPIRAAAHVSAPMADAQARRPASHAR